MGFPIGESLFKFSSGPGQVFHISDMFFFLATSSGSAAWSKSSELGAEKGHELGAEISGLLQKWQVQGG
jgi:hypothetical protein